MSVCAYARSYIVTILVFSEQDNLVSFEAHSSSHKQGQNNRPQLFVQYWHASEEESFHTLKKNVFKKAMNHNLGTWDVPPLRLFVTIIKWLHPISCLCLASWPTYSIPKHHTLPSLFSTLSYLLTHPSEYVIMSPVWLHALGVGPSRQKHMPKVVDSSISLP